VQVIIDVQSYRISYRADLGPADFGDPTLADAILDRLLHSTHKIQLEGESMRKRAAAETEKTAANQSE
jgi:hypothetical protein